MPQLETPELSNDQADLNRPRGVADRLAPYWSDECDLPAEQDGGIVVLLGFRHYDPTPGRFISVDSYRPGPGDTTNANLYLYGGSDPVNNSDPSGLMNLPGQLVVVSLVTGIIGLTTLAILPTLRNSSAAIGLGKFVPVDATRVETHYHSIRIRGAIGGADAVFDDLRRFTELDLSPVTASANVNGVGDRLSFDMTPSLFL